MINYRKMLLLQIQFSLVLVMFYACSIYSMIYACCLVHFVILASHSFILVTELSEIEPVEPTEPVEPEPGVPFAVEPEVNQGKQLNMNP